MNVKDNLGSIEKILISIPIFNIKKLLDKVKKTALGTSKKSHSPDPVFFQRLGTGNDFFSIDP